MKQVILLGTFNLQITTFLQLFYFLKPFIFQGLFILSLLCVSILLTHIPHACLVPAKIRNGLQLLWDQSQTQLLIIMWLLGLNLTPLKEAQVLLTAELFPVLHCLFYLCLSNFNPRNSWVLLKYYSCQFCIINPFSFFFLFFFIN